MRLPSAIPGRALALIVALVVVVAHMTSNAQTKPSERLEFGTAGLDIAPAVETISVAPRTVTNIGELMLHESGTRRLRLARDLGECRSPLALPYLRQAFTDTNPALRAQAAQSAGRIGDPSIASALQPLLRDPIAIVRREAVVACALIGDQTAVTGMLRDEAFTVRSAALSVSRNADAVAEQLGDVPPALRVQAIRRLGALGAGAHAMKIVPFLNAEDVGTRSAAIEALTALHATGAGGAILPLLRDEHPGVRRAATVALTLSDATARGTLAFEMLRDPEPEVRQAAADVLAGQPRADACAMLAEQLDDGDEPLRVAARDALVALKDPAVEVGAKLLTNPDPRRREDGSYILGHLRSPASMHTHVALLKDADWIVVAQAAWSLGVIRDTEAGQPIGEIVRGIPSTAGLLPRQQQDAYAESVIAAARLNVQQSVDPMARLIKELAPSPTRGPAPRLRAACIWGFGMIGSAADTRSCDALAGIVDEILEQEEPKVEAMKALGHLRYAPAADAVRRVAETSFDPQLRWMACWSYERITGSPIPYVPPVRSHSPDVSIVDLPRQGAVIP